MRHASNTGNVPFSNTKNKSVSNTKMCRIQIRKIWSLCIFKFKCYLFSTNVIPYKEVKEDKKVKVKNIQREKNSATTIQPK